MNKKKLFLLMFFTISFVFVANNCYAEADTSIVSRVVKKFYDSADKWYAVAQSVTLNLFYLIAILEIAYLGIQNALGLSDIKETITKFVLMLLASGFFLAVIKNYKEWSSNIVHGLQQIAGNMTSLQLASDNPFKVGLEIVDTISKQVDGMSFWDEGGLIILMYLSMLLVMGIFALISARIIIIKCESIIAMMAALILVAFGASQFFREYAINTLKYILAVAFKLFTMQLVIGVGFSFIEDIKKYEGDLASICVILSFCIILYLLAQTLPETVANIISISTGSSGAGVGGAMRSIGSATAGAVGGAIAGGMAAQKATQLAKKNGVTGFAGIAKGAMGAMKDAYHQGKVNKTDMNTTLRENLNKLKATS